MASTLSFGPGDLVVGFLCAVETAMGSSIRCGIEFGLSIADGGRQTRRHADKPPRHGERSQAIQGSARGARDSFAGPAGFLAMTSAAHPDDEFGEAFELLLDDGAGGLVGEHALLRVDLVLRRADED